MSCQVVHVINCDGPPTTAPGRVGQHWIDNVAKKHWLSVGTDTVADWIPVDGGIDVQQDDIDVVLNTLKLNFEGEQITVVNEGSGKATVQIADRVVKLMTCTATENVGDLVYQSPATDNLAVKAVDNTTLSPVVGQVIRKPSTTTCVVQVKGFVDKTVARGRVYLSTSGAYTNSPPTTGYLQTLGWSCGSGQVEINPSLQRVKRS